MEENKKSNQDNKERGKGFGGRRSGGGRGPARGAKAEKEFEQKIIDLARVTRVMAGGKRMRFRATVAIGDRSGTIGLGTAKGADVTIAINKAVSQAKKALIIVPIVKETIPNQVTIKYKASKILLKPAPVGTGIKVGGVARMIIDLSGIPNIVGKILGSNNKINISRSVMKALTSFKVATTKPAMLDGESIKIKSNDDIAKIAKANKIEDKSIENKENE
jgi:small subunit ribosomal protein S5